MNKVIGLMSGTSMDGVDAAMIETLEHGKRHPPEFLLVVPVQATKRPRSRIVDILWREAVIRNEFNRAFARIE